MDVAVRGKTIVDNLLDYRLPKVAGVRDYVFYTVPSEKKHGYGWSSRLFFGKFFKNHLAKDVGSLEELIDVLHAEVTGQGVDRIREIILVSHANSQAMLFPVLSGPQSNPERVFPYVNQDTLAALRSVIDAPDLAGFKAKRSVVVSHLHEDSWVTIRACNFGNSKAGLYATYSFFGGRANVYAPVLFQHFGIYEMDKFARIDTPAKLHSHLVHQHFLKKGMTPERKRALLQDFYETALFSEPHSLAFKTLGSSTGAFPQYEGLIDDLNAARLSPSLVESIADFMATMSVPGWVPSREATIMVVERTRAWTLRDKLSKDTVDYSIFYELYEKIEAGRATLWVQARLVVEDGYATKTARQGVTLQLFLNQDEEDILRGRLFRLGGYAEGDADTNAEQRFNSVRNLLKDNKFSDGSAPGVDIIADFLSEAAVTLAPPPASKITLVSPAGWNEPVTRAVWKVDDPTQHFLIKLENPSTRLGLQGHVIAVYIHASEDEDFKRETAYLVDHVTNPDTPGTELAASFDQLSYDDLLSAIAWLRTPFRPGTALYIHHAQQSMARRKDFEQWKMTRHPAWDDPAAGALVDESEWELHGWERDDKAESSYVFNFNDVWADVKSANPTKTASWNDLFIDEDLAAVLHLPADLVLSDLETDSSDPDTEPRSEFRAPFAKFAPASDKGLFDPVDRPSPDCLAFDLAVTRAIQLKDLDPESILKSLETERGPDGSGLYDTVKSVLSKYSFLRKMGSFVDVVKLPWVPSSVDSLITEPIKRVLEHELKAELSWWLAAEGAAQTSMIQAGLGVLWAFGVIAVPAKLMLHAVEEEMKTDQHWEDIGALTAIRQWLRRVEDVTYNADTLPDLHEIDVSTPVSAVPSHDAEPFASEPYYIGRFFLEQLEENPSNRPSYFTWAPERMKIGFDRGVMAMKFNVADELVHRAESAVNAALYKMDLDGCKIGVLIKAGLLDFGHWQAQAIGMLAKGMLDHLPRV